MAIDFPEVQPLDLPETPTPEPPLKASQAMRLGILIAPEQVFGELGKGGKSCAKGAILAGWNPEGWRTVSRFVAAPALQYGDTLSEGYYLRLAEADDALVATSFRYDREWGDASPRYVPCPVHGCIPFTDAQGTSALVHLNDHHRWTRERIANWLDKEYGL